MSVLQDVLEWSADRPIWQRDALRRILTQEELSDSDIDELKLLCLAGHGIADKDNPAPQPVPLAQDHLPPDGEGAENVQLISIRDAAGVNALLPGQKISFNPDGMTVVFGYNGSGKSGYARILRMLCQARHRSDQILPNAFSAGMQPDPSATVEYSVGESYRKVRWSNEGTAVSDLKRVSFFDADCAAFHVDNTNQLAFTPSGLDVLKKLVSICKCLEGQLQQLIQEQEDCKPASLVDPKAELGTEVRKCLDAVQKDSEIESFRRLAVVSNSDLKRLDELNEALGSDPRKRARECRNAASRLSRLIAVTNEVQKDLSPEAVENLRLKHNDLIIKKEAAATAAEQAFGAQPLTGIGEGVWQRLWEAARAYSVEQAYKGEAFPCVDDEALCVLCQQPLSSEGKERLTGFERFIREETQRAVADMKKAITKTVDHLKGLTVGRTAVVEYTVDIGAQERETQKTIKRFHGVAWKIRNRLMESCQSDTWTPPTSLPESPTPAIMKLIETLNRRADELDQAHDEEFRAKLILERNETLARQWLSKVLDDVESEISRKGKLAAFAEAARSTVTTGITRKATDLTSVYVTTALQSRLAAEIKAIGGEYLRIALSPQGGQQGSLRFKVGFQDAGCSTSVKNVLSEGEFRCISLASFLAELSTEHTRSALVFDDPVCSLDHLWRRKVAKRLAAEARERQVVVFTHEISFLVELIEQCKHRGVTITHRYLRRCADLAGECVEESPWHLMKLSERIGYLRKSQQAARAFHNAANPQQYDAEAQRLYGLLRESWERAVEEVLLNGAVRRFERGIQTMRLKPVADICDADIKVIDEGMSKCSRFLPGHDDPDPVVERPPDPDELMSDIDALDGWVKQVRKRR